MKRVLVVLFLLGIGIFLSYFSYRTIFISQNLQSLISSNLTEAQKEGIFKNLLGRKPRKESQSVNERYETYRGKYFSLTYPSATQVYDNRRNRNITNNKSILEFFRLDSAEPRFNFVAQVLESSVSGLDEFSGVNARRKQKDLYQETVSVVAGRKAIAFLKERGGAEKVSFIFENGKIYSFAVSTSHFSEAKSIYDQILVSVRF